MATTPHTPQDAAPKGRKTKTTANKADLLRDRMAFDSNLPRKFSEMVTRHNVPVTREQATEWLASRHPNQREMSSTHAETYCLKMEAGSWRPTAQGLIFDWFGRLIDGQHRLTGYLMTDPEKYPLLVTTITTGCDPEDIIELDGDVAPRKVKDLLAIAKVARPNQAATAFKIFLDYATTHREFEEGTGASQMSFGHRTATRYRASRSSVLEWILKNQKLVDHVTEQTKKMGFLRPPAIFSGFYLWVALETPGLADEFFGALISGAKLKETSPIFVLRKAFETMLGEKSKKTQDFIRGALLIKAWNAWRANTKMKVGELKHNAKTTWPLRVGAKPLDW